MINSLRQKGFRGKLVYTRLHPVQLQLETSLSFVAFCLFAEASFNFSYFLVISSDKAHAALLPASSLDRPRTPSRRGSASLPAARFFYFSGPTKARNGPTKVRKYSRL
eukprot:GHVT01066087.1.p1 GENE.GHVT01066087.1~~GHVT01066087.1.p1  ORF type:complete len:108 (+),score=5.67 GHVT01066087.1:151-474(+)